MDLRAHNLSPKQLKRAAELVVKGLLGYQPFVLSDRLITGAGYEFATGLEGAGLVYCPDIPPSIAQEETVARNLIDPAILDQFRDYNDRLDVLYDSMVELIVDKVGDPSTLTYADIGCNSGYFPLSFSKRGAKDTVGFDSVDYAPTVKLLNEILGTNARFEQAAYDHKLGTIPNAGTYDVVLSIAVLVHMSDPLRHLAFLGSIARRALFIWTNIPDTEENEMTIRYLSANRYYTSAKFPYCFDVVQISPGLLRYSLELMGFTEIHPLPPRPNGMAAAWFNQNRGYLAIRSGSAGDRGAASPHQTAQKAPPPRLVETIAKYNVVEYAGRFHAIPQSLGSFEVDKVDLAAMPEIVSRDDLDGLRKAVSTASGRQGRGRG